MRPAILLTAATLLVATALAGAQRLDPPPFRHTHLLLPDPFELAPGNLTAPISEHSVQWPLLLQNYLGYTGDDDFVRQMVENHLPDWLERYRKMENGHGALYATAIAEGTTDWTPSDFLLNVYYYRALLAAADLQERFDQSSARLRRSAQLLHAVALVKPMRDDADKLGLEDAAAYYSLADLTYAQAFKPWLAKLDDPIERDAIPDALLPFIIEAAFLAGQQDTAIRLLEELNVYATLQSGEAAYCTVPSHHAAPGTLHWCNPAAPGLAYLLAQYVYGIYPAAAGWSHVRFNPDFAPNATQPIEIGVPAGRITIAPAPGIGYAITTPIGVTVEVQSPGGTDVVTKARLSHTSAQLRPAHLQVLEAAGWQSRVGDRPAIWISAAEQTLRIVQNETILFQSRCATAFNGLGSEMDSLKTPLGWHEIRGKIGENAPWGQVFRARRPTNEIWQYGEDTKEDLVLTRVLLLDGLEPGLNKGGNVDSMARNIYIHGTNDEAKLGTPSSHGCIRLFNDDVIELFTRVEDGALVLITAD